MIVIVILLLVLLSASSIVAAWGRGFLGGTPGLVKDMVAVVDSNSKVCDSNLTTEVANLDSEEDLKFFMSELFRPNLSNTYSDFKTKCLTPEAPTPAPGTSTETTAPEPEACSLTDDNKATFPNAATLSGNMPDCQIASCNPGFGLYDSACYSSSLTNDDGDAILNKGEFLVSEDGKFRLLFDTDGKLRAVDTTTTDKYGFSGDVGGNSSSGADVGGDKFVFQPDGNLVVYADYENQNSRGSPKWSPNWNGVGGMKTSIETANNTPRIVLYKNPEGTLTEVRHVGGDKV